MIRDLNALANQEYDLLVIGGGISGAFIAWDATLRGLSVALIEQKDFGSGTSANSLKTVHGGLRYLQDANIPLMRSMISERKTLLRIAPSFVKPLPFLMPTYGFGSKSRAAMFVALSLNDVISADRNRRMSVESRLPRSRTLSRAECLNLLPGLGDSAINGGALWYDAQIQDTERLLLSVIQSAAQRGAVVANYVEAAELLLADGKVLGARVVDRIGGEEFDIRAKLTINATGGWGNRLIRRLVDSSPQPLVKLSVALNIITPQIVPDLAFSVLGKRTAHGKKGALQMQKRLLFIAPWRQHSLIGTEHLLYDGEPGAYRPDKEMLGEFLSEVNSAYPHAHLNVGQVRRVHWGFLPAKAHDGDTDNRQVRLVRESRAHDHAATEGVDNLISAIGVKYTTARKLAARTVDMAFRKWGRTPAKCATKTTVLDTYLPSAWTGLAQHDSELTDEQVQYFVNEEMAHTLSDVLLRRTQIGAAQIPSAAAVDACTSRMASLLNWSAERRQAEVAALKDAYVTL